MKTIFNRITLLATGLTLLCATTATAQQVVEDNFQQLRIHYSTPELVIKSGDHVMLTMAGYRNDGNIGMPSLPQLTSLLTIPFCEDIEVTVENAVYDTVSLPSGIRIMPQQRAQRKDDTVRHSLVFNEVAYNSDQYVGSPLAAVERIGVGRDRNMAQITFSPVMVNNVSDKAIVCRSADFKVNYISPDEQATIDHFVLHHTPAFSVGSSLNTLIPSKYVSNAKPIRMVIVAPDALMCNKLNEFITWKRRQGYRVDLFNTDALGIQSPSAIATRLANLYTNATATDPAPAYLIIVGDVAQIPAHTSRLNYSDYIDYSHITDLYYTTWSNGDVIPDCYHGRFSATDTITLGNIIDKTLLYEQYLFEDDSYLARAALIAGVDVPQPDDNGYNYADPAMDYLAKYYINSNQGFNNVAYYKNLTTFAPDGVTVTGSCSDADTRNQLLNYYNDGAGWINYSAHGDWYCWGSPYFSVDDANSMSNIGKPSFMIGNCCLSCKFDRGICFGEALLRRGDNAGACIYIGASNYTYWTNDFDWAVGSRTNVYSTMNATYDPQNLGNYDRLFHTHDENFNTRIYTAGQFMLQGNMAVNSTSGTDWGRIVAPYYWEIYHLMGDPTLMPWIGTAMEPYAVVSTSALSQDLGILTMPYAYVAIVDASDSMRVVDADFADANGNVSFDRPSSNEDVIISVTAQRYKPFSQSLASLAINNAASNPQVSVYPNPVADRCFVECNGMQCIQLINALGQTVRTLATSGDSVELDLQDVNHGIYILRITTATGIYTGKLQRQ